MAPGRVWALLVAAGIGVLECGGSAPRQNRGGHAAGADAPCDDGLDLPQHEQSASRRRRVLTFAVVSSRGRGPLSAEQQFRLQQAVDEGTLDGQLVFPVAERSIWFNSDRSIAVVVWSSGLDPIGAGSAWHATDESFTAFSGNVWPRGQGWEWKSPWAPQLGRFCERPEFPGDVGQLSGTFTAVHVRSRGSGCVFADPFSIRNVYLAERPECAVFSSRAAIAAWIAAGGHAPRRDPLGIGWLGFAGVVLDDVTGFEGVRVLRQCAGRARRVGWLCHQIGRAPCALVPRVAHTRRGG